MHGRAHGTRTLKTEKPKSGQVGQRNHLQELMAGLTHFQQTKHRNDSPQPSGQQRVRVDGGDSKTPLDEREYVRISAGYGEGKRASNVRRKMT